MDEKLTIEKFLDFQEQLQKEILSLEFERKEPNEDGNIQKDSFCIFVYSLSFGFDPIY